LQWSWNIYLIYNLICYLLISFIFIRKVEDSEINDTDSEDNQILSESISNKGDKEWFEND